MPQSKEPFRDPSEPLFEQRINELEKGEGVGEITSAKLGKEAVTPEKASKELTARRLVYQAHAPIPEKTKTGQALFLLANGAAALEATALKVNYAENVPAAFFFTESLLSMAGKTTKFVFEVALFTNETAPAANFTFGLFPGLTVGGAEKKVEVTYEIKEVNSKVVFTAPAAKTAVRAVSSQFTLTSGTIYGLGYESSAETAAKSLESAILSLWVLNV